MQCSVNGTEWASENDTKKWEWHRMRRKESACKGWTQKQYRRKPDNGWWDERTADGNMTKMNWKTQIDLATWAPSQSIYAEMRSHLLKCRFAIAIDICTMCGSAVWPCLRLCSRLLPFKSSANTNVAEWAGVMTAYLNLFRVHSGAQRVLNSRCLCAKV